MTKVSAFEVIRKDIHKILRDLVDVCGYCPGNQQVRESEILVSLEAIAQILLKVDGVSRPNSVSPVASRVPVIVIKDFLESKSTVIAGVPVATAISIYARSKAVTAREIKTLSRFQVLELGPVAFVDFESSYISTPHETSYGIHISKINQVEL